MPDSELEELKAKRDKLRREITRLQDECIELNCRINALEKPPDLDDDIIIPAGD